MDEIGMKPQGREAAMADGAGVQIGFRMGAIDGPATPPKAARCFFTVIAAGVIATIGEAGRGNDRNARASSMACRSDAPPVCRRMRSSRSPCSLVAASVHFPGMPGGARRTKRERPLRPLVSPMVQYLPACVRGEGSSGRHLLPVCLTQRQFRWRSWGVIP